jgi:group II intron reverse transcriptase/maturase
MSRLEQRIEDPKLLHLIRRMLKAQVVMPEGVVVSTEEGTPQGGPLSPLLSNIVLDELDAELSRRGHRFVRYADDCNIYVRSERSGERVMASVVRFIERKLRLKVNAAKSAVARPQERHFLGFSLRRKPMQGGSGVNLSKRSLDRIYDRVRELTPRNWGRQLRECILGLRKYLLGWIQFFRICTSDVVYTLIEIDAHVRRRLRAILLKQWKRKRTIVRRLAKLKVKPSTAARAVYGGHRSTWRLSDNPVIEQTLGVRYFARRGLLSVEGTWKALNPRLDIAPTQLALGLG